MKAFDWLDLLMLWAARLTMAILGYMTVRSTLFVWNSYLFSEHSPFFPVQAPVLITLQESVALLFAVLSGIGLWFLKYKFVRSFVFYSAIFMVIYLVGTVFWDHWTEARLLASLGVKETNQMYVDYWSHILPALLTITAGLLATAWVARPQVPNTHGYPSFDSKTLSPAI